MLKRRRLNHMNPIQKDICNLEKQILKDRELLMDLAGKSQTLSDALYKDKINFMKCEIDYLQNQYRIIEKHYNERSNATVSDIAKSSIAASKPVVLMERESDDSFIPTEIVPLTVSKETPVDTLSSTEVNKEVKPFVELTGEEAEKAASTTPQFNLSALICEDVNLSVEDLEQIDSSTPIKTKVPVKNVPVKKASKEDKTANKTGSLESKVGGVVMAVLAAGLIFVSIVLIAMSAIPAFGDFFKQAAFYLAGSVLVGSGIVISKKSSLSKISPLLISIGMGELYVSLFVSNLLFKSISDLMLFGLIFLWSASFIFLRKFGTVLFNVIGNIGLTVAVYLGFFMAAGNDDAFKMLLVILFCLLSKVAFYIFFKQRNSIADNVSFHIFNFAELVLLVVGNTVCKSLPYAPLRFAALFVFVFLSLLDLVFILPDKDGKRVFFGIGSFIYGILYILTTLTFLNTIGAPLFVSLLGAYAVLIPFVLISEFKFKNTFGAYFVQVVFLLTQIILLIIDKNLFAFGFIVLLLIPFTVLSFIRKNHIFKNAALLSFLIYAFVPNLWPRVIVGVLFTLSFLLCIYLIKGHYKVFYKTKIVAIDMIYVITCAVSYGKNSTVDMIIPAIIITVFSLINLALMYTPLSADIEKKKDLSLIPDILNSLIATASLLIFLFINNSPVCLLFAAWAFILGLLSMFRGYFENIVYDKVYPLFLILMLIMRNPLNGNTVGGLSFNGTDYPEIKLAILGIFFIVNILLLYSEEGRYSKIIKYITMCVGIFTLTFIMHQLVLKYSLNGDVTSSLLSTGTISAVTLSIVGILALLTMFSFLGKNLNKENDSEIFASILCAAVLIYAAASTYKQGTAAEIIWMFIILAATLVKAYITDDDLPAITAVIFSGIMLWANVPTAVMIAFGLSGIIALLLMMYFNADKYSYVFKLVIYCLGTVYIFVCSLKNVDSLAGNSFLTAGNVILLGLAVQNLIYAFTPLNKNPQTDTKDMDIFSLITNHVLVWAALITAFVQGTPVNILSGLLVIALLPIGLKKFWEEREENSATFVLSIIECTIIPFLLCYAWGTSGVVANIVAIIISMVYIVLGFMFSHKFPRIYGLVVTIILIFKMILIDFKYSSMLGYALGFLIAGVICLSISLIYTVINKKME